MKVLGRLQLPTPRGLKHCTHRQQHMHSVDTGSLHAHTSDLSITSPRFQLMPRLERMQLKMMQIYSATSLQI